MSFLAVPIADIQRLLGQYEQLQQLYHQLLLDSFARHWRSKPPCAAARHTATTYQWFLEKYPGLIDQIHHRSIASFLGMTPVTLSRQRSVTPQETKRSGQAFGGFGAYGATFSSLLSMICIFFPLLI